MQSLDSQPQPQRLAGQNFMQQNNQLNAPAQPQVQTAQTMAQEQQFNATKQSVKLIQDRQMRLLPKPVPSQINIKKVEENSDNTKKSETLMSSIQRLFRLQQPQPDQLRYGMWPP